MRTENENENPEAGQRARAQEADLLDAAAEIESMHRAWAALRNLDAEAQARALRWLASRLGVPFSMMG